MSDIRCQMSNAGQRSSTGRTPRVLRPHPHLTFDIGDLTLGISPCLAALLCLLCAFIAGPPARAGEAGGLKLEVTDLARSLDRVRKERFLTVTVEITGRDPAGLRRVQPLREDFRLLAGKKVLP